MSLQSEREGKWGGNSEFQSQEMALTGSFTVGTAM